MFRGLLVRSRLLTVIGCGVLFMVSAGAGCSATASAPTLTSKTLTVYLSAPASLTSNPGAQDVLDAEQLAFDQLKGSVKSFTLNRTVLKNGEISDHARTAIQNTTGAVGYVGEIVPPSTDSLGITNAVDLLQVSPAEGGPVPTSHFQSYSTYGRTFASMAPGTSQQAPTLLTGSAGRTFVSAFRSTYGHAPSAQAVFGYAAMASLLKALENAGSSANDRGTVRNDFFALKNAPLVVGPGGPQLGTYTVNKNGTIAITPASG
jgi:hypothetical protein